MERTRTTWFWLSVVSIALMAGVNLSVAADATTAPPAAATTPAAVTTAPAPTVAAASLSPACSPLAGAWTAKLSSPIETVIQTFKFVPINEDCSRFVVNSQASTRSAKVIKFWPTATHLTEFVGTAGTSTWSDVQFTAIGYGVERCETVYKVVFIAIMTGRIEVPDGCGPCSGKDPSDPTYNQADELNLTVYVSYFDADQDKDRDGFPDCDCKEAVLCVCFETKLKRVQQMEPCEESQSFVACLEKCKDANTPGTGRAFFRVLEDEQKVCFVLTVKGIRDVTKATIQVNGADVVTLFPFPPETKGKDGDCDGLLSCGCFYVKDCVGTWKNKKFTDVVKAIADGQASVIVVTKKCPKGEICGKIEDP
jgi:hypothetical protein